MLRDYLLSAQAIAPEDAGLHYSETIAVLGQDRVRPSPRTTKRSPIVMIEDRDQFAAVVRTKRFSPDALEEAFEGAVSVTLVAYVPRTRQLSRRLGQDTQFEAHRAAIGEALSANGGTRIFIRSTSDRIGFWKSTAHRLAPPECVFRILDGDGACRVVFERRAAA